MTVLDRPETGDRAAVSAADAGGRTSLRFAWEVVDPDLIRLVLGAVYDARGQHDDASRVSGLDDTLLVANATHVLGRPLRIEHMDVLVDVLLDYWLPGLPGQVLADIVDGIQLGLTSSVTT